jgi:arylsulfatase A-like enzyme
MSFASYDVQGYAKADAGPKQQRRRLQLGADRSMNRTPGVNEMRLALFAPPPASFTFRMQLPSRASISFGTGVPLNGTKGDVTFIVELEPKDLPRAEIARFVVPQRDRYLWQDRRVDLSAWAEKEVRLTLRSEGPKGSFAFFSNPVVWRSKAGHKGKNILFVLVDTLRANAVKSVAGEHPVTPNLDALASRGAVFTSCHSLASWTRSSMLGMFTGEQVSRFDPQLNTAFWLPEPLKQKMYRAWPRLLTWHLREHGYWVEAIGNNFFLPGYTPIGFDRGYDQVTDIRAVIHDTPAITRGAVDFLERMRSRPFFLYLHYDGPHHPYYVPPGYAEKGARAPGAPGDPAWEIYLGEARFTDEHLRPLFEALDRLGLAKDTLVVVTADHGEVFHDAHDVIFGENNRTRHAHGWSLFQEVMHVPLIMSLPGAVPAGKRIEAPVSHMDLVPTLLDLSGLPPMVGHGGKSLVPTLREGKPPPREEIVAIGRNIFALRQGRWKYIYREHITRSFRRPTTPDKRHYVPEDLYDLENDPQETRNLASAHPERAKKMRERLLALVLPGKDSQVAGGSADPFAAEGLRLSLRLWGGRGPHLLKGTVKCDGQVVVRGLHGPMSHAAYRGQGEVALQLQSPRGQAAEVELEFLGCPPASIALSLLLDGRAPRPDEISAGPIGLELISDPARLPLTRLPALTTRRPPPILPSPKPRLHLWLGSSWTGDLDLGGGKDEAARLADQMLRDAGYTKGPASSGQPPERPSRPSPPGEGAQGGR